MKRVVGIAFIKNNKILIVQSRRSKKTNSYTFVGGGVKKGEQVINAALREVREEIHNGFEIRQSDLSPILCFKEPAASDKRLMIEMTIFLCHKEIDVSFTTNAEIIDYHWYSIGEKNYNVSSSIKDHFIPYALDTGILTNQKKVASNC